MSPGRAADLELHHPGGSTLVFVGRNARGRAAPWLSDWVGGRQVFLVTTPEVEKLVLDDLRPCLSSAADLVLLRVPDGEAAKTIGQAGDLWEQMLAAEGRRDSRVIALGGGSVGDLAGFVAATFLRGVDLVLVPTTLLAQVDASIGGKTGVDVGGVKNSVGALYPPAAVVSDVGDLATLPQRELRSGLVEVVKIAAATDLELFERLEANLAGVLAGDDPDLLGAVVRDAVRAKIRVVEEDPRETGRRRVLNFGHTLGHAIEAALDYRRLRHGEAVAYGMLFAVRLAAARGVDAGWLGRIRALIEALELPALPVLDTGRLLAAMRRDKKSTRSGLHWVLPTGPGRVEITPEIDSGELLTSLEEFLAVSVSAP